MTEPKIKDIETFIENETPKTKLTFSDSEKDVEIVFEGNGKLKTVALEA